MQAGKIKKLVRERGFGFISDSEGKEFFFHQTGVLESKFDALSEGQAVEFEIESSPKGPRAVNVKISGN
ncbi:MAG: cold shock domain-containing protein [Candidatus Omnitrophica bacterium]|nr:cold shock domain-containing protein [Candidatus Omnitrophota bacterium]